MALKTGDSEATKIREKTMNIKSHWHNTQSVGIQLFATWEIFHAFLWSADFFKINFFVK